MELKERVVKNKTEAQMLAEFLWGELQRHVDDCLQIYDDLDLLEGKWKVKPRKRQRAHVKP